MYEELTITEQKDKRRGRNYSIALHLLILLLLFLLGSFKIDPEETIDTQYAVAIDFTLEKSSNSTKGREAAGASPEKAEKEERAKPQEEPLPEPEPEVQEEPKETVEEKVVNIEPVQEQEAPEILTPEVTEVLEETSPVESFEDDVEDDEPIEDVQVNKVKVNKPTKSKASSSSKSGKSKPTKATGSGSGSKNTSTKTSTSKGSGKAKTGTGGGKDASGNDGQSGIGTGGHGKGAYDDSGDGIFGRRVVKLASMKSIMSKEGRIVLKVCIDPNGKVTFSSILRKGTTIRDKKILKSAAKVAKRFIYENDPSAPDEQCGKYTFIIERN